MRQLPKLLAVVAGVVCAAGVGLAAEQTILGNSLIVRDPEPGVEPTKRKIRVTGREKNSANSLAGDPTQMGSAGGAVLEISANGGSASRQAFTLAQGMSSTGRPFWSGDVTKGFTYSDAKGDQGPVKSVRIRRSSGGSFALKITISGKGGPLIVVPPNPGTDGCVALSLGQSAGAGDRYSVRFGPESKIKNSGDEFFRATMPMVEGVCPTLVPCGTSPFPSCGEVCPGEGVCGAFQGPDDPGECACFSQGVECGGSCSFDCTSPADCDAKLPGCVSSTAGACPAGTICTAAIAEISSCPAGTCVLVTSMCVP